MATLFLLYLACALAGTTIALLRPPQMPRYAPLLAIAAVPQLGSLLGIWIPGMFVISVAAFCVWCLSNRAIPGVMIVALGVMLNMLVMAFHDGAMPIQAHVLAVVGDAAPAGSLLWGSKDVVVHSAPLASLSDWMIVSSGAHTLIASPGDLIAGAGILYWLVFSCSTKKGLTHDVISRQPRVA
jgi:Family of unknown function (DUF5317)